MFTTIRRAVRRPSAGAIRVGVDLQMLSPGWANGGVKEAIYFLLRTIRAAHKSIEFSFLTNRLLARELERVFPGCPVIVVRSHPHPFGVRANTRPNLRCAFALLHCSSIYAPLWYSPAWRLGKPMTALVVDLLHREHPEFVPSPHERAWRDELIGASIRSSFRIQTISQYVADRIVEYYPGLPTKPFVTYLPRRMYDEFQCGSNQMESPPYFLYPANLWPHKNHEKLLEAFAQYRSREGDWNLVLTGFSLDDPRVNTLKRAAAELRLGDDTVRFKGHLPTVQYAAVLKGAGALVFPSRYEGFGMPVVEAMANGIPVAASSAAALPEVAGGAALLFDPLSAAEIADAMWNLSQNPGMRDEFRKRGLSRAAQYSAQLECEKLARVFEEAAESRKR